MDELDTDRRSVKATSQPFAIMLEPRDRDKEQVVAQ